MGQRLVITVYEPHKQKPLCNIYYHWSAYSTSALSEAKILLDSYDGKNVVHRIDYMAPSIDLNQRMAAMLGSNDAMDRIDLSIKHNNYLNDVFGIKDTLNFADIEDPLLRIIRIIEFLGGGITSEDTDAFIERFGNIEFKKQNISHNFGLVAFTPESMKDTQNYSEGDLTIRLSTPNNHKISSDVFWFADEDDIKKEDCCIFPFSPNTPFKSSRLEDIITYLCEHSGPYIAKGGMIFHLIE